MEATFAGVTMSMGCVSSWRGLITRHTGYTGIHVIDCSNQQCKLASSGDIASTLEALEPKLDKRTLQRECKQTAGNHRALTLSPSTFLRLPAMSRHRPAARDDARAWIRV